MNRILVVDDEDDLCEILSYNLENEGYKVDISHSAEEVLTMDVSGYDLLLLDVMMGEISGFKLAHILKSEVKTANIPIIFITARDTENDALTGFNIGADDYIVKPFSLKQVSARVKAVLRRSMQKNANNDPWLSYAELRLDTVGKKVFVESKEITLTRKEFEMLQLFLQHIGQVLTREKILASVWNDEVYVLDRTVDVNITRLRKKIVPYDKCIVTRQGFGYCFDPSNI